MDGQNKPALVALRQRRAEVIEQLSQHFADDVLGVDEFEHRIDLAHRADAVADLDALVADLAAIDPSKRPLTRRAPASPESTALVPATADTSLAAQGREKRVRAVMSEVKREGTWRVPKNLKILSVMGEVKIDFREAHLPPGEVHIHATAVMASIEIVVPPTLAVECNGSGFLGEFHEIERAPSDRAEEATVLVIEGKAVMGSVEISTRLPGETGRDAKRRRKRERRALRKAARTQKRLGRLGADRKQLGDGDDGR